MNQCTRLKSQPSTIRFQCLHDSGHSGEHKFSEVVPIIDSEVIEQRDRYKAVFEAAKKFEEACRSEEGEGHTWSGKSEAAADALFALLKS